MLFIAFLSISHVRVCCLDLLRKEHAVSGFEIVRHIKLYTFYGSMNWLTHPISPVTSVIRIMLLFHSSESPIS